jgi:hypothetical protein
VIEEFPKCDEAWANLGYARLMMYCDGLETQDLRRFDVGHIAAGGFYHRPKSLEPTSRGIDEPMWAKAVEALQQARRLNPDRPLVNANLGLAYLVSPKGKNLPEAEKYGKDAESAMNKSDASLEPLAQAALRINLGVAHLAAGRSEEAARNFDRAEEASKRIERPTSGSGPLPSLSAALLYNRGLLLASAPQPDKRRQALGMFEKYLTTAGSSSAWWPLAYERYAGLCKDLGVPTAGKEADLLRQAGTKLRLVTGVQFEAGKAVTLADPLPEVRKRFGDGLQEPVLEDPRLLRISYVDRGVELIASGPGQVLAICLVSEKAPPLSLRAEGPGTKPVEVELRVGMTREQLDERLKGMAWDFTEVIDPDAYYRYYPDIGVAVRARASVGKVEQIVVTQLPRKSRSE